MKLIFIQKLTILLKHILLRIITRKLSLQWLFKLLITKLMLWLGTLSLWNLNRLAKLNILLLFLLL